VVRQQSKKPNVNWSGQPKCLLTTAYVQGKEGVWNWYDRTTHKVDVPDAESAVLGAGGQLAAIRWEPTEPDLVAVLRQHLSRRARKLVSTDTTTHLQWVSE